MQPTTVVEPFDRPTPIKRGDTVRHTLADREFICQDKKQERWMNMNPYYVLKVLLLLVLLGGATSCGGGYELEREHPDGWGFWSWGDQTPQPHDGDDANGF